MGKMDLSFRHPRVFRLLANRSMLFFGKKIEEKMVLFYIANREMKVWATHPGNTSAEDVVPLKAR
ncbi:MAG: hypothetical protein ACLFOY_03070 [Desulfatibacillaceae bacterium]